MFSPPLSVPAIAASHLPSPDPQNFRAPLPSPQTTPHDTRRTIALPPLVPLPYLILRPIPPSSTTLHAWERECTQTHPGIRASPLSLGILPP